MRRRLFPESAFARVCAFVLVGVAVLSPVHSLRGATLYSVSSSSGFEGLPPAVQVVSTTSSLSTAGRIGVRQRILQRIKKEPWQILTIPLTSAAVGWITNKVAVDMIFFPLVWRGIPLRVFEGQPFGILGWQGIVPAKAGKMAERMVDMVTSQLLSVDEVFQRIDPGRMANLLAPEISRLARDLACDGLPHQLQWVPESVGAGLTASQTEQILGLQHRMLKMIVRDVRANAGAVLDVKDMVVSKMLADRQLLVDLFQKCGSAEFPFLVNSGLWVGFLLGIGQMLLWCLYDKPWTLPVGGAVVGYLTNYIALKLIFEPVEPLVLGRFSLQGLFLRRQPEVSLEFAKFFASRVLTSRAIWQAMMFGGNAKAFFAIVDKHAVPFVREAAATVGVGLDSTAVNTITAAVARRLPSHVHVVYDFMDGAMDLEKTLADSMTSMTPRAFEGVLHPVFQEDEFTLIVAGGILGGTVGLFQMAWTTSAKFRDRVTGVTSLPLTFALKLRAGLETILTRLRGRSQKT